MFTRSWKTGFYFSLKPNPYISTTPTVTSRMATSVKRLHTYNEAIAALNSLQTNAAVLEKVKQERLKNYANTNLAKMRSVVIKSGMSMDDINSLNVIHVSGTKGKGSTCAFTESILRHSGLKTGFFSSPHLVSATERIRLDGLPISQEKFARYFWELYDKIVRNVDNEEDKPAYFKFLTVLAFNVFFKEKVDVVILEVGIGGAYDSTNIVENPVACAITTLDFDHTKILGETIEEIAWHKAGIMKPDCMTFVNPHQPESALEVIRKRAKEIGAKLSAAPNLDDYDWNGFPKMALGLYGPIHANNASLALQLSRYFLSKHLQPPSNQFHEKIPTASPFEISLEEAIGLRLCTWPGRSQTILHDNCKFFLDGAHTEQSMWACRGWFDHVLLSETSKEIKKVLIFNATGDRKPEVLLATMMTFPFDLAVFCTNNIGDKVVMGSDNTNLNYTKEYVLTRCNHNKEVWDKLQEAKVANNAGLVGEDHNINVNKMIPSMVVPNICDALALVRKEQPHLLFVTGSFHLVGGVLSVINPVCFEKSSVQLEHERDILKEYSDICSQNKGNNQQFNHNHLRHETNRT